MTFQRHDFSSGCPLEHGTLQWFAFVEFKKHQTTRAPKLCAAKAQFANPVKGAELTEHLA